MKTVRLQRFAPHRSVIAMKFLTIRKSMTALLFAAGTLLAAADDDFNKVDGPNVRVMRNEDGSKTLFLRSPDNRTLTKKTFSANGVLELLTVYRMDANENPLSCKIFDGQKQELFKVSYGYRKSDGQLIEERMFDSRVRRVNPEDGVTEMPVRRFIYTYDGQGKRSRGQAITPLPGKSADEVYRKGAADPDNPFKQATPVSPSKR
jgi:hypothetical protein